jgi:phosphoribosyl 1,2-cyclic phosphodiesterase
MAATISYEKRAELEKIQSQWNKLTGLHSRDESSAAIVRAATAAELAATFAIRREFLADSQFTSKFIDSLLIWANGISGKIDRLLIPMTAHKKYHKTVSGLKELSAKLNKKRNAVAHQGEFCNPNEAEVAIQQAKEFIETLVRVYEPEFSLKDKKRKQ